MRYTPATTFLIIALLACGEAVPERRNAAPADPFSGLIENARARDDTLGDIANRVFPALGCIGQPVILATTRVVSERLEKQMTAGWAPSRVVDVSRIGSGFVAVDVETAEMAWFSDDLRSFEVVAQQGPGPGELQNPVAVAFDPATEVTWVLDTRPPRLIAFDSALSFVHSFRLDHRGSDVAVASSGDLIVTADLMLPMMRGAPDRLTEYAWLYSPEGEGLDVLRAVDFGDVQANPSMFNLPGPTPVRAAAGGGHVVIYYPTSGYLEVVSGVGDDFRTVEVCVRPEVREAYAQQLAAFDPSRPTQSILNLIEDVRVMRDSVVVLSGLRAGDGSWYTEHIPLAGESKRWTLLSDDIPLGQRRLLPDGRILTFSAGGNLTLLAPGGNEDGLARPPRTPAAADAER